MYLRNEYKLRALLLAADSKTQYENDDLVFHLMLVTLIKLFHTLVVH